MYHILRPEYLLLCSTIVAVAIAIGCGYAKCDKRLFIARDQGTTPDACKCINLRIIRLNGVQVAAFNENKSKSLCVRTWSNHMAFALYQHFPVALLSPFCHVMTFSYVQYTKFPPICLFNILFFLSFHRVEHAPAAEWIDNLIKHTTWCTDQYPIFQFQQTNKMFQRQGEESKVCEVLTAQRRKNTSV